MTEHIAVRLTTWCHHYLRWADVRARPFSALVRAYLVMDLRNRHCARATATGPTDVIAPLFWGVEQYLLVGGLLSGLLFARVDAFFFALVAWSFSMAVMATAIIVEFHESCRGDRR